MALTFIEPAALWLLLLLPAFWLFAWATRRVNLVRLGRARLLALVAVRTVVLAALVLALAGAQLVRLVQDTAVVFLIDGSDSVSPALREQALAYVNEALATADAGDQAAVVVFGATAAVERAPGPPAELRRLSSAVVGSRTDIGEALQLGLALLPAEAQKRIVLLSDGAENQGRAAEAARLAALRGVPIEVLPLRGAPGPDVALATLDAPATAREGQALPVVLAIESGIAGTARVELLVDGELVSGEEITLAEGRTTYTASIPAGAAGFRRIEARVTAPGDSQPLNNRAAAFAEVSGPPRVLLAASDPSRAEPLRAALAAAGLRPEIQPPALIPADPTALRQFAAVALVDVLAADVPAATQRALVTYVEDQGGGLLMVGGAESFGAGGWRRTLVADLLPVELDPPAPEQRPDLALALVIDRSGSMSESSGGLSRLDLAKEAVYQATLGLSRADQIGVVAFDDVAFEPLPIQPLPDLSTVEAALSQISEGGGTNIRAGVERAVTMIAGVDARVKHVILLTDGLAESNYADLLAQMRDSGVTISVVSLGQDANPNLADVASAGGGAFYRVLGAAEVPRIFLAETVRVARRDLVEGEFTPALALAAPPVRDLGPLPPLLGYNRTAPKEAARTLLVAPEGDPVLAVWQRGLGRSLAWTSDLKGQWAAPWLGWEQFPRFAAGLIDAVLPPAAGDRLSLETRVDGVQAIVDLVVAGEAGLPAASVAAEGRLVGPGGVASDLSFVQVAPGRYRAVAPADEPGVYLAQVAAVDGAGQAIGAASGGLVVSYSPEYLPQASGPALLADLAALSGGRVDPPATDLFATVGQIVGQAREIAVPLLWLALALLPIDIALRRLFLRPSELAPLLRPRSAPAVPASAETTAARLQSARARRRGERGSGGGGDRGRGGQGDRGTGKGEREMPGEPQPAPSAPAPSAPSTAPVRAAQPPAAPQPDDALATLLAAKNRRKR